jgi:hypothetical protein
MAAVARGHGDVELARFEAWDPGVRPFDLLISGQAWHSWSRLSVQSRPPRCSLPSGRFGVFRSHAVREAEMMEHYVGSTAATLLKC